MTAHAFIDDIAFALGGHKASVADSVAAGRTLTGEAALLGAGFRYHHMAADDESAYDLARAAVTPIAGHLDGVGAIVYATCLPANASVGSAERFADTRDVKHLMDFPASRLQTDFDLQSATVVGLTQQACTGLLGSVRIAHGLLATDPALARVLCLTADRFPPGACYEQAYSLISDGAAACTVSRDAGAWRLLGAQHITNGALVDADDDETVGAYFTYTHRLVAELLAKTGLVAADIDWVVPQNTDAKAWQILSRLVGVDFERVFFPSLPDIAHMISGDNLVNLAALDERGLARPGDKALLVMAGYGMNWQALALERT